MSSKHNFKPNPHPIDNEAFVPPAVRRAAEAADALQRSTNNLPPAADDTITIIEPEAPTPPKGVTTHVGNEPPPTPAPEPQSKPDPEPRDPASDPDQSWENRYKSMHGQFMRAQRTNGELVDRIANLEALIEGFDQRAAAAPATTTTLPVAMEKLVTPEEIETYGSEMIEVIGRRAMEATQPLIAKLQEEIAGLKGQVQNTNATVQMSAREKLHASLDTSMPDWRVVNDDPEFLTWLALPNPYTGVTRMKELQAAYEQNHSGRVLAFFKGFKAETAATDHGTTYTPPAAQQQAPAQPAPRVKLEDLAAPGRASTTGAQAPDEKPIITSGQITEFYARVRRGEYRGKDEEKAQHEAMIFAAQREGRVRQ